MRKTLILIIVVSAFICTNLSAQELQAKIVINHNQIQGTDASIFDNLQQT